MNNFLTALVLCLAVFTVMAEEQYRAFDSVDGRTIEARIVEYDANRGRLRIERRGGKTLWVTPDVFSDADQTYIKQWVEASMFMLESNLKVSIKKVNLDKTGSKKGAKKVTEHVRYEITLQSRAKEPLRVTRMEYCYYIEDKKTGRGEDTERSESGNKTIRTLKPGESILLHTDTLGLDTLYHEQVETTRSYDGTTTIDRSIVKLSEEDLRGIWVRIYGPKVDGRALYRDISYPKDLHEKVEWKPRD